MGFNIVRNDGKSDEVTVQSFVRAEDAYALLQKINDKQTAYKVIELNPPTKTDVLCRHCFRTAVNQVKCIGMCVADTE